MGANGREGRNDLANGEISAKWLYFVEGFACGDVVDTPALLPGINCTWLATAFLGSAPGGAMDML